MCFVLLHTCIQCPTVSIHILHASRVNMSRTCHAEMSRDVRGLRDGEEVLSSADVAGQWSVVSGQLVRSSRSGREPSPPSICEECEKCVGSSPSIFNTLDVLLTEELLAVCYTSCPV